MLSLHPWSSGRFSATLPQRMQQSPAGPRAVIGIWLGFPLADPIVGLIISVAIFVLLWGTARDIGRRLLDGVDPSMVEQAEQALSSVPGITDIEEVRLRWTGHRLNVDATVTSDPTMPVGRFHELEHEADQIIRTKLPGINAVRLNPSAHPRVSTGPHHSPTAAV
jgi:divalent metal cation (Fe/Co/Zn/Cd) transporter